MIRKLVLSIVLGAISLGSFAQKNTDKPKLVVGLMVDQMRWDYLYRFANRYQEGGFKRMLRDGFSCENTLINYIPTVTAIGHSSVYTGSVPAITGIAGNDWIDQATGKSMYCTSDNDVTGVGTTASEGKQSPRNLLASTITDQVKLASNFQSKVIGVALKDRGSILPAGHFADAAYWFEAKSGDFITSNFYMEKLPKWVQDFNSKKLAEKYLKEDWKPLYDLSTYTSSIADNNVYEGKYAGEQTPTLPRATSKLMKDEGLELIKTTPMGNQLTLDFAKDIIKNERMGNNPQAQTDFLCVSLSSTDYVGHRYSLSSVEIEDIYLRLDQQLAEFFNYLDKTVGKGEYTVFLTADHGASYNSRYFMDMKGNGGYFYSRQAINGLNAELEAAYGQKKLVTSLDNYQVNLNNLLIDSLKLDREAIKSKIIQNLKKVEGVAYVVDMESANFIKYPEIIREKMINGYNPKRSGSIQIILEPQWYGGSPRSTGTTHGVWSAYDSHIPLVFMGWGIKHGVSNKVVHITDIASTLAALLRITEPNGSIGEPITAVLGQ